MHARVESIFATAIVEVDKVIKQTASQFARYIVLISKVVDTWEYMILGVGM